MIWHMKHRRLGHVLMHEDFVRDIIEGKMMGKATQGKKRMELLHDNGREGLWTVERFNLRQMKMGDGIASETACQKPAEAAED